MNNRKRAILSKIIVLVILCISGLFLNGANTRYTFLVPVIGLIIGFLVTIGIGVTFFLFMIGKKKIKKPRFEDALFSTDNPLVIVNFMGLCFISIGVGRLLGQFISNGELSQLGILFSLFGIGLLVGVGFILLLKKQFVAQKNEDPNN